MPARMLKGKDLARRLEAGAADEARALAARGRRPSVTVLLVGDHAPSETYVARKGKACERAGIAMDLVRLPGTATEAEILAAVARANDDDGVDGILVQLPLPEGVDEFRVVESVRWDKDVDGFHPANLGRILQGRPGFVPCTAAGILELLRDAGIPTAGRRVVVVGRSMVVGLPLANLLLRKGDGDATVTVCHSRTKDLAARTREAEILVVAAGRAGLLTGDMVADGAVVIDVGTNRVSDPSAKRGYRLVGDVDVESVVEKASVLTPVPGGVGPLTVAMLMVNTVRAARLRAERDDRA